MHRRVLCIVAGIAAVCAAAVFLVAGCGRTERAGDELTRTQESTEAAQTDEHAAADALAARWRINPICIDAGHGGRDSGTLGADGALEKTITLDIAGRVRRRLEAEGATVVMTRTDDRFVSLDARASTSNKAAAGLFVSIHANGFHEPDVRGFEIYYFNGAHSSKAVEAAEAIERAMHDALDTRDRGVRRADFSVLAATQCPAVLVEVGYMTNPDEAARLARADYRQQIADALVAAIKTVGMDESAEPAAEGQ
jgi:N-acetylmuramoyl-L-alanine amidase